jgi:hypothetical protein
MNFVLPILSPAKVSFCLTNTPLRSTVASREYHSDPRQKVAVRRSFTEADKMRSRVGSIIPYLQAKHLMAPLGINRSRHADEGKWTKLLMKLNPLFKSVITHCSEGKLARVASLPLLDISKFKSRNKVELIGIDRYKQFKAIHPNASVNCHKIWY